MSVTPEQLTEVFFLYDRYLTFIEPAFQQCREQGYDKLDYNIYNENIRCLFKPNYDNDKQGAKKSNFEIEFDNELPSLADLPLTIAEEALWDLILVPLKIVYTSKQKNIIMDIIKDDEIINPQVCSDILNEIITYGDESIRRSFNLVKAKEVIKLSADQYDKLYHNITTKINTITLINDILKYSHPFATITSIISCIIGIYNRRLIPLTIGLTGFVGRHLMQTRVNYNILTMIAEDRLALHYKRKYDKCVKFQEKLNTISTTGKYHEIIRDQDYLRKQLSTCV
jgi:hypothetical protein